MDMTGLIENLARFIPFLVTVAAVLMLLALIDGFLRRRLRALLRKQQKRPGRGQSRADHRRWPNAFFAEAGLFALHTAWQDARHPR